MCVVHQPDDRLDDLHSALTRHVADNETVFIQTLPGRDEPLGQHGADNALGA
jgi:hypothetical protein